MYYKIIEIRNAAAIDRKSIDGMVYVRVQFGRTQTEAENSPSVVNDFLMQISPRVIEWDEGLQQRVDRGQTVAEDVITANIEAYIRRLSANGHRGDKTHKRVTRDDRDPTGLLSRQGVQNLTTATRQLAVVR